MDFHVLLPEGTRATRVTLDGAETAFANVSVRSSPYADFPATVDGRAEVEIRCAG